MKLTRVIDVKCTKCWAKPGRMCTNKPAHYGGGIYTVPAHEERRAEFNRRIEEQGQLRFSTMPSEATDASEIVGDEVSLRHVEREKERDA